MAYDISINPKSPNQFTGWTSLPVQLPQISAIGTVFEMPAGWGTNIGKIAGRAKGFAGIGTVRKDSNATVFFPEGFSDTPIVDIQIMAPTGFSQLDDMGYSPKPSGSPWFDIAKTILFTGDRNQIYSSQRFVHKLRERRDVPVKLTVFNTNNGFALEHDHANFSVYAVNPVGIDEYIPYGEFDGRVLDTIFIWHAFGV